MACQYTLVLLLILCFAHFVHCEVEDPHTETEVAAINKLRPLIAQYLVPDYMKSDNYHYRVLKSAKFDLGVAVENVKKTSMWRKDNNIDNILNEDFSAHRRSLLHKTEGIDREGSPVLEIYLGKWELRKFTLAGKREVAVRCLIQAFETMETKLYEIEKSGVRNVSTIYILEDVDGFSLSQTACLQCIPIIVDIMRAFVTHYPSMLKKATAIHAPRILSPITAVFKQVFPPEIADLVSFYGHDKGEWFPIVLKDISEDQLPKAFGGTRND